MTAARIPDRLPGLRPLALLKFGDRIVTNEGEFGTVTAPPDERHPRTARVALDNGDLYDMGLSRFKRVTPPDLFNAARSAFAVSAEERTWPQAASPLQTMNRVGS